jgi:hypothetical protein
MVEQNGIQPIVYLGNSLSNKHIGIPKVVFKTMVDWPEVGNYTNVLSWYVIRTISEILFMLFFWSIEVEARETFKTKTKINIVKKEKHQN